MGSLSKKRREGREASYPAPVILQSCPRCGAKPGDKCIEEFGGETIFRRTPCKPRVDASRPILVK